MCPLIDASSLKINENKRLKCRGVRARWGLLAPTLALEVGGAVFGGVVAVVPEAGADKGVGEILLGHKVAGIVVGVLVAGVIAEVFHQRGGGVAYGERHGQIAGLTHGGQGGVDGHVG